MSTQIESLELEVKSSSKSASTGIDSLRTSLEKLRGATKGGLGLTSVSNQLSKLNGSISKIDSSSISKINGITKAIQNLSSIKGVKISSTIASQITAMGKAVQGFDTNNFDSKISSLVASLQPLSQMPKQNISSYFTQLKKIPTVLNDLKSIDMDGFANEINRVVVAIKPLATEMEKVSNGFSAFPQRIQRLISSNSNLATSNESLKGSYINLWAKMNIVYNGIKRVSRYIASAINESNEYIENVNLFNVAMGKYADEASEYAERVGEAMGIDPGEWMRNQGLFMTLATGFGVVNDRAYTMSKNLTQLGYDLSSFFNISYEDAMAKLQSGIAGELEPLRRIGYDLSQARLQQEAYTLGINKKISAMTQAEKAELRYYAIMTQVTTAHGDMARTINAPANQLRILKAQLVQAGRAIGNIFIPALNAILPYAIAVLKVIRNLAATIADFFGFEMPEVDYSGVGDLSAGFDDLTDNVGGSSDAIKDATDNLKKLKDYTMGFDELNIINPDTSTADSNNTPGGGVGGVGAGTGLGFKLPEYDWGLKDAGLDLETIKGHLDSILGVVAAIGAGIVTWKLAGMAKSLADIITAGGFNKVALGISLLVSGITLGIASGYDIGKDGLNLKNALMSTIAAALMVGGSLLAFGTGPLGWTIGITTAIVVTAGSIAWGKWDKAKEDDLAKRFGTIELSDDEISQWASELTTNEVSVKLDLWVDQQAAVDSAKSQVTQAITELNKLNFKIQCGLDVTQAEYQEAVDALVSSAQTYIEEKQVSAVITIDFLLGGTEEGDRLTTFANTFYSQQSDKVKELGKKLKEVVATGFAEGEWIPEKLKEAKALQTEIESVIAYMSDVEYEAKLTALKADAANIGITVDNFTDIVSKAEEIIQGQLDNAEGIRLEGLKIAKMEYDENVKNNVPDAKEIYDATVAKINSEFNNKTAVINADTFSFAVGTLHDKFATELSEITPLFQASTQELFANGTTAVLPEDCYTNVTDLVYQLYTAIESELINTDISPAARSNISDLLEEMQPTIEEQEKLASKYREAGESVPKNISDGLKDVAQLKVLAGDLSGINYMIGDKLSTDQDFLNMLATCNNAGQEVSGEMAEGLLNNLQVVTDAANGTITLINDTIGEKVLDITPTLVKNLEDLGVALPEGLLAGAEDQIEKDKKSWLEWSWLPWNWFKKENDINSPSGVFEDGGMYIAEGLFKGVDDNIVQKDYDGVFGQLKKWFDNLLGTKTGDSTVFDKLGQKVAKGLFGGVDTKTVQKDYDGIFGRLKSWFSNKLGIDGDGNSSVFQTLGNKVASGLFGGVSDNTKQTDYDGVFGRLGTWFTNLLGIGEGDSTVFSDLGKKLTGGLFSGVRDNVKQTDYDGVFGQLSSWFSTLLGINGENSSVFSTLGKNVADSLYKAVDTNTKTDSYTSIFTRIQTALSTAWTSLTTWWSGLSLPTLSFKLPHFSWSTTAAPEWIKPVMNFLNIPASFPKLSVSWYANGGFPDEGELFVAREAGAEMVGSIGRKTAVANNDQIVSAVSAGVAKAVGSVMGNMQAATPGGGTIRIKGSDLIYVTDKANKNKGATISNNFKYGGR